MKKEELESLELIVFAFLDLAENRAKKNIPITREDWNNLLDNRNILKDVSKISRKLLVIKL